MSRGWSLAVWLLGVAALLVVALATSVVAERKGQQTGVWFVLGILFPVAALIAAAVIIDPRENPGSDGIDLDEALQDNAVARALYDHPGMSAHQLAQLCEWPMYEVLEHLRAMEQLELASRTSTGRWHMTTKGQSVMSGNAAS